ncbi:hypothetical protein FEV53_19995 [Palleronia caenipelagi]|uniref:Uncharacterized protein n=1 Tax=Palleronia caenipelagi TaxID=2489174 RepID=A0A547PHY2_9RHOB|nr:hypothetical protein FEV53_19995 [Palleronia caenipelagi]
MSSLDALARAAFERPGERVIHVTNEASAKVFQAKAMNDAAYVPRVILNATELKSEIKERKYDKWIGAPLAKAGGAVRAVVRAPSVKIGEAEFGLGGLASVEKQAATASIGKEAIFVFENSIDSDGFGQLLSYYSAAEPEKMPTIVLAADKDVEQLRSKVSRYSESFVFHETYGSTSHFWSSTSTKPVMSLSDIVLGLVQNNTLAVATADFSLDGIDSSDFEHLSQSLSAAYAVVRSVNFEFNKFASAGLAKEAIRLLSRTDTSKFSTGQQKAVNALWVLFSLWDLYLHENRPDALDQSMQRAAEIGSDLLVAHCQRLMNLSAGYSAYSRHSLETAEKTFRRFNQTPMAIYCRNNALLNDMHSTGRTTDAFQDLIDEATEVCPNIFSMVRLFNNAGVGAMLDSRFDEALEFFERSQTFNALPIHRFGLEVNALVCRYMMGDSPREEELERIVLRVERANLDKRYAYHQAIVLLNTLRLQEKLGHASGITRGLLRERAFMDYGSVLSGRLSVARFLEMNLPTTAPQGRYKGQRGDFILRTDLVPIIHFGWF